MFRSIKLLFLGLISTIIVACYNVPKSESTGEYIDSATTTAKVKTSLINDLGSSGFDIKVKTYKDVVQLSGFVDARHIKYRAGAIASGVDGVKLVRNDIVVKSN